VAQSRAHGRDAARLWERGREASRGPSTGVRGCTGPSHAHAGCEGDAWVAAWGIPSSVNWLDQWV
jgi:hypothetical protein